MSLTGDQANALSQARARANRLRLALIAALVFFVLLVLAGLLQKQQTQLSTLLDEQAANTQRMCEQRRVNTLKTNANWDELAKIEQRNKFINEDIRAARLKVYREAKLIVPSCL